MTHAKANTPDSCRELAGVTLPAPRLQLRWAVPVEGDPGWGSPPTYLEQCEGGHRRWICHYELVLPLRREDIRREREAGPDVTELVIPISKTRRGSCSPPDDAPFRDGTHAGWDAPHLGNLPIYVLPFAGPAVLLSDLRRRQDAEWDVQATQTHSLTAVSCAETGEAA